MRDENAPEGVDPDTPSVARMYDYYLGGKDNYAADREAAERAIAAVPGLRELAVANRRFLGRVVAHLAEQGIDQFIDLGTGLPTQRNVHEVAQEINPMARVVYVDNDPTVLAHARALLAADDRTQVIHADVRDTEALLARPEPRELIDFDRPVAVLMFALLHTFNAEADPYGFVRRFTDAIVPGSMLAISHAAAGVRPETDRLQEIYKEAMNRTGEGLRTKDQVALFFDGYAMVEPGLVPVTQWRPEDGEGTEEVWLLGGLGRKL